MSPASSPPPILTDTSPEVEAAQLRLFREMSAQRKLELVEDANATARILALTGLAARHLGATEDELSLRLFHLLHGSAVATKVWGPLPEDRVEVPSG